jgi:Xaa-Pro aminopeptidase
LSPADGALTEVPPIQTTEYEARTARIREAMATDGVDALVLFSDSIRCSSVRYVVDFWPIDGYSDIAMAVVILPRDGEPALFVSQMNLLWGQETSWFPAYPFSELTGHLLQLRERARGGTVAVSGLSFMPVGIYHAIQGALGLSGISIRSAEPILAPLKARKSPAEMVLLRRAGEVTAVGLDAVHEAVVDTSEKTELEVARHASAAMYAAGGDGPAMHVQIQSGPHSAYNNIRSTDRVLARNESVLIEMGARYGAYVTDIARGATIGEGEPRQHEIIEVAAAALTAGCDAVRPGMTAGELNKVIEQSLVDAGYLEYSAEARGYGTGHGTGMDIEEEEPWIRPGSPFVLQERMSIALKASIFVPGLAGVRVEDDVFVTQSGADVYTPYPRVLNW